MSKTNQNRVVYFSEDGRTWTLYDANNNIIEQNEKPKDSVIDNNYVNTIGLNDDDNVKEYIIKRETEYYYHQCQSTEYHYLSYDKDKNKIWVEDENMAFVFKSSYKTLEEFISKLPTKKDNSNDTYSYDIIDIDDEYIDVTLSYNDDKGNYVKKTEKQKVYKGLGPVIELSAEISSLRKKVEELEKENEELKSKVDMFNRLYRNYEKYFTPEEICLEFLPEKIKMLQIIDYIPHYWPNTVDFIEKKKEIVKNYKDNFAINGIDCLIKFRDESYEIEMSTLNFEVTYIKVFDDKKESTEEINELVQKLGYKDYEAYINHNRSLTK